MSGTWCDENRVLIEDFDNIMKNKNIEWEKLRNSSIIITGVTGLIGSLLTKFMLYASHVLTLNLNVNAIARNKKKAEQIFCKHLNNKNINIFTRDFCTNHGNELPKSNFIIHAASATNSKFFIENPVETILTTVNGTVAILEHCLKSKVESAVYISSMEVYGKLDHEIVTEEDLGLLNYANIRSSYPASKRMAEMLCLAYHSQYKIPIKIVRPTLVFGAGVLPEDNRVFAQFLKSAIQDKQIILHTRGETKRDYIYTSDAICGIISILLNGKNGDTYNLSNPDSYCTIFEMAKTVAELFEECEIKFDIDGKLNMKYAEPNKTCLNISKLNHLNSFKKYTLKEAFIRYLEYLND